MTSCIPTGHKHKAKCFDGQVLICPEPHCSVCCATQGRHKPDCTVQPTGDGRDITPEDDEHIAWVNSGFRAGYQKAKRESQPHQSFYEVFGSSKAGQSKDSTCGFCLGDGHEHGCPICGLKAEPQPNTENNDENNLVNSPSVRAEILKAAKPPQPNTDSLEREIRGIYDDPHDPEYVIGDLLSDPAISQLTQLFNKYAREIIGKDEDVARAIRTGSQTWATQLMLRNDLRQEQRAKLKEEK